MNSNFPFTRYLPSVSQLFYAFLIMTLGLTLGKWLSFLFDGSSFATLSQSALSIHTTSSTVMAMKRSLELIPVCFAASCVSSILVAALKKKEEIVNISEVFRDSWRVGVALSGILGAFFLASTILTIIDLVITLGENIPFLGALFSIFYGLMYPIATLCSLILILFSYFVALGPLHAIGFIEQARMREYDGLGNGVTLKGMLLSVKELMTESGAAVRSVLIAGWSFGVIPLFCYKLFLLLTLHPVPIQDGFSVSVLQNFNSGG